MPVLFTQTWSNHGRSKWSRAGENGFCEEGRDYLYEQQQNSLQGRLSACLSRWRKMMMDGASESAALC